MVNNSPEIALYNYPHERTKEEFIEIIKDEFPAFDGNIETAAELLFAFSGGMNQVISEFKKKNFPINEDKLELSILDVNEHPGIGDGFFLHIRDALKFIGISVADLEFYSLQDINQKFYFKDVNGDPTWHGTLLEMFRQAGIEETHHYVYFQTKDITEHEELDKQSEIDATKYELRALLAQLRDLKKRNADGDTIQLVEDRLNLARGVRKEKFRLNKQSRLGNFLEKALKKIGISKTIP